MLITSANLRPIFIDLLRQEPVLSALHIAEKFGLVGLEGMKLIENMICRIFGKYIQDKDSIVQIRQFIKTHKI